MDARVEATQKTPLAEDELYNIIKNLQNEITTYKEELIKQKQELTGEIATLRYQLNNALRHRFGRRSEKHDERQFSLFSEVAEPDNLEEVVEVEKVITVASHTRGKKPGRKPLPKALPRVQQVYDLPESEKVCSCGCTLNKIGEETSEQLDVVPAKVRVIQHIRYKYACKHCEGNIKTAKAPQQPIPRSIASPGLLSHIAISKYCDHLPLYRQEKIIQRMGVEIARNTLSYWMIKIGDLLRPLYKLLQYHLTTYDIAYADETRVQVLKEEDRPPELKSYMWSFIGGPPEKRSVLYHYNQSRAHTVIIGMLEDFEGLLHCDGYIAYDTFARISPNVHLVGCWMHCRRRFYNVAQSCKSEGLAHNALKKINKLYRIEKDMKAKGFNASQVYQYRQEHSKPKLQAFKSWLEEHSIYIPPKSPLGDAFGYALNQWSKLNRYITDGRLEMDNGLSERQIKPFVIGRKNWMFSDSVAGIRAGEVIYSLIETAKLNGIEPYSYLRTVFKHIPTITTEKELEALLPFNIDYSMILV